MLLGCQTLTPHLPDVPPIPANLMQPCQPLTPLTDATGAFLLRKLVEVSSMYYDCSDAHNKLIEANQNGSQPTK
jgi:hypothetical protein